jgi:prolyl oligopeptidase
MKSLVLSFLLFVSQISFSQTKLPPAKQEPVKDAYFGVTVEDPYRYMENMDDEYVKEWMKQQSDYARSVLDSIPGRDELSNLMKEFDKRQSYVIFGLHITENDKYFYQKRLAEEEVGKIYFRDGYEGQETLLFDPAAYDPSSSMKYVISYMQPNWDGSKLAFGVAAGGSENATMLIMDVAAKKLYPEKITRTWLGSPSWLPDNNSFLYSRLQTDDIHDPKYEEDSKTWLHVVGRTAEEDIEIFSREKYPDLGIKPSDFPGAFIMNKDDKYLMGGVFSTASEQTMFYAPLDELTKPKINWKPLTKKEDKVVWFTVNGDDFIFMTSKDAPNYRLAKTDFRNPDLINARVLVAENPSEVIDEFALTKDGLYYTTKKNGVEGRLYVLKNGETMPVNIKIPFEAGSVGLFTKGKDFPDVWVYMSGWTNPFRRYKYDLSSNTFTEQDLSPVPDYLEFKNLVVEEVTVPSHDGVQVPLSIAYDKSLQKDGSNPTFLYGYGAYGSSSGPWFSPNWLTFTLQGGMIAVAHVRGGGELGDTWHKGGYKTTKSNTWKDFIACAEYLIINGYTSPPRLAINGGSAGGILVGRAMTERPDLFAAVISQVGCMNSLRFENTPNGPGNAAEFGTVKDSAECMALIEMDSYLHLKKGVKYPATLVTAGMNDPRVIAWQPAKFAARLQNENGSDKPVLLFVDYEAGHGIGNPRSKQITTLTDVLAFALWQTGHPKFQVK